jgi:hypothetical protein
MCDRPLGSPADTEDQNMAQAITPEKPGTDQPSGAVAPPIDTPLEAGKSDGGAALAPEAIPAEPKPPVSEAPPDGIVRAESETCPQCGALLAKGIVDAYASSSDRRPSTTCPECPAPKVARKPKTLHASGPARRKPAAASAPAKAQPASHAKRPTSKVTDAAAPKPAPARTAAKPARATATPAKGASGKPRAAKDTSPSSPGGATLTKAGALPPGGLEAIVLEYLAAHPGEELSPTQVAKALGRSSGAVANALAKHAKAGGQITLTRETPKRYTSTARKPAK